MPEFNIAITISSFIAGVLTFFAPCTVPLVPAFLGIISGANINDLQDPQKARLARWAIFRNAVSYVIGFSLVFILFGISFTFVSQILGIKDWIQVIGGGMIVIFGFVLMGWLQIPLLNSDKQIHVPQLFRHVSLLNSFLLGALFAIGWSPCVGPLLGSILLLASTSGTVLEGAFLLVIFSIGLGLPFLLTALLIGKAFSAFSRWGKALEVINKIAGLFLIGLGVLLLTNQFESVLGSFKAYFYRFNFFEVFINKYL